MFAQCADARQAASPGVCVYSVLSCEEAMKRNMREWIEGVLNDRTRRAFPLMLYAGADLLKTGMSEVLCDGGKQAACVRALSERFPAVAAITAMDLSVEAEAFGSETRYMENEPPTIVGSIVRDLEGAELLAVPSIGGGRTGAFLEATEIAARAISDRPVFGCTIGPFSLAGRLCGMIEALMSVHSDPHMLHAVIRKAAGFLKSYSEAFRESGAQGIVIAEPAAGLISPEHCDEFSSSYVASIVEAVQDDDFMVILHNCAATPRHVRSMVSSGAGGLHFGNAVNMREALNAVPSGVLAFGNIDPSGVLKRGSEQDVRRSVLGLMEETSSCSNFVLSSGCDIPPGTPLRNIDALFTALDEWNGRDLSTACAITDVPHPAASLK